MSGCTTCFLRDFESNVGEDIGNNQRLVGVERLEPSGFFDEAVALKALHEEQRQADLGYDCRFPGWARAWCGVRRDAWRPREAGWGD